MFNVHIQSKQSQRTPVTGTCTGLHLFLCPVQEKNGGGSKGGGGGRLHWRVQGSTSSPTGIGSRWRVFTSTHLPTLFYFYFFCFFFSFDWLCQNPLSRYRVAKWGLSDVGRLLTSQLVTHFFSQHVSDVVVFRNVDVEVVGEVLLLAGRDDG